MAGRTPEAGVDSAKAQSQAQALALGYRRDGYALVQGVVPLELIGRVSRELDVLAKGPKYVDLPAGALCKMDNTHIASATIHELVSHGAIGRVAAAVTGAKMVQVFASQALIKPSGAGQGQTGNVGWHQDLEYWQGQLKGELLTVWVAVSDVTGESGPMRFVRASQEWGLLNAGDFFSGNLNALKERILSKRNGAWDEVPGVLGPGGVSFHHCLTVHGSGPNHAAWPRKSVAIHIRTERSSLVDGVKYGDVGWLNDFADEKACPVMYRGGEG